MEMGAVGLTQQAAEKAGIDVVVSEIDTLSRARYYPGSKPLHIKLVSKLDGTIIGCQMFGQEAVAEKVDTMSVIILQKLKCDEVVSMEFSYAPPVSMVVDPIAQAAEDCLEQLEKLSPKVTEEVSEAEDVEATPEEEVEETSEEKAEETVSEDEESFTQYLRNQGLIE
jgi:NADH oxidase (H2O2-forming)